MGTVQCECGHRFYTTKNKTQCGKCGSRFFSYTRAYTDVGREKDKMINQLKTKLLEYEKTIKSLIPKLEKEQKETLDQLRNLLQN